MDLVLLHWWMTQSYMLLLFCCFDLEYISFEKTYIGKQRVSCETKQVH